MPDIKYAKIWVEMCVCVCVRARVSRCIYQICKYTLLEMCVCVCARARACISVCP
jgi:hypothetical protein